MTDPADVWLGGHKPQEGRHGRLAVQKAVVHVNVQHLRPTGDLWAGHTLTFSTCAPLVTCGQVTP